jgi:hypothetical protein
VYSLHQHNKCMNNHPLKFIRDNWVLIVFIGMVIIGWANFQNQDTRAAERINEVEEILKEHNVVQQEIQVKLSQIQTDILWIRKAITE